MKIVSKLASKIEKGDFIVTTEFAPGATAENSISEAALKAVNKGITAINATDNCHDIGTSSIATAVAVMKSGAEPILQIVTRDRNRIAIQSELLGASCLGIKNVLCLSGYHQALSECPQSANVYDIDSIQLVELVTNMSEKGVLINGTKIEGQFSMLAGGVANPFLEPIELNMLRLHKKIDAGAKFIQTAAIFDIETFGKWFDSAKTDGIKTAIIAGVEALNSAVDAQKSRDTYTDYCIPDSVIDRLKKAGSEDAQKKEGIAICIETIKKLKQIKGLGGIHIMGEAAPEIIEAALS